MGLEGSCPGLSSLDLSTLDPVLYSVHSLGSFPPSLCRCVWLFPSFPSFFSPIHVLNSLIDLISISCLYLLLSVPVQSTYIHTLDFSREDDLYSGFHEDARARFHEVSQYDSTFTSAITSMFIAPATLNLQSARLRNFLDIVLDFSIPLAICHIVLVHHPSIFQRTQSVSDTM